MGKPLIGEVVVLPFPQTNLQSGKRRPALVVADLNGDDLILCQITSQFRSEDIPFRWRLLISSAVV
jgi:PemK-like, MazF-like toxin of type II toxin-antitoxin system